MKKRYLYALLLGVPGLLVSGMIALVLFGGLVGALWLFVFGDNPWPPFTETILTILLVLVFLSLWIASILIGYRVGKKLESDPVVNWTHILIAGGFALLFILAIVLQQFSVGNLGPKSDSRLCMDFCIHNGYSASGVNSPNSDDHTCTCFDRSGNEALKVPWNRIDSDAPK